MGGNSERMPQRSLADLERAAQQAPAGRGFEAP